VSAPPIPATDTPPPRGSSARLAPPAPPSPRGSSRVVPVRRPRSGPGDIGKGLAFLSPWIIGFTLFTAVPILMSLYFSFTNYSLLKAPTFVGLDNYRDLFHDKWFWVALSVTGRYALMALPASMFVSLGVAILLNQPIRSQAVYRTIIFLPSLVPIAASAMIWFWLFNTKLGLINYGLSYLHIPAVGWLTNPSVALPALAFMSLWGVGNTVVIYLAGLQDVPKDLYEAAALDGATGWRRMWHVTLPMLSPVIFFNLVIAIIGVFRVMDLPYIMTTGGPAGATEFIALYVYQNAFMYVRMGYASAMAWMQLLIVFALTAVAFWSSKRWVYYQGK
jgi:multiple sugar transport system permease protein